MTTTQLSCLKCVVEEGGVTKAALRLGVTQPAVSQQLQLLAAELGCQLFHRRGKHYELTSDGRFAYEKAKAILSEMEGLPDALRSRRGQVSGTVRIGSAQVAAKTVVGDAIHGMSRRYSDVKFSLLETGSRHLPELVLKSQIDLGVGIVATKPRGIRFEALFTGRMLLICSRKDKLSSRESISRRDLRELNLIRHSREDPARALGFDLYGEKEEDSSFRLEAMNTETIISYVKRNLGVALALSYVIDWLKPSGISTIELEDEVEVQWGIMSDPTRRLPKAAEVFIDTLRERLSKGR